MSEIVNVFTNVNSLEFDNFEFRRTIKNNLFNFESIVGMLKWLSERKEMSVVSDIRPDIVNYLSSHTGDKDINEFLNVLEGK